MAEPPSDRKPGGGTIAYCSYGFRYIRKSWLALVSEAEGARIGEDPEHVHRMRVASRRLRAAMPIFRSCFPEKKYRKWRKEIKNITRSLGEARDLDVQIAFLEDYLRGMAGDLQGHETAGGLPEERPRDVLTLLGLLQQKRELVQPAVEAAGASLREGGILEEFGVVLSSYREGETSAGEYGTLHRRARKTISARITNLLAYEPFVHDPDAVPRHHEMRIAAKRLRYTLETFNRFYSGSLKPYIQDVRTLQDIIGQLHDCDVWIGCLPRFLHESQSGESELTGEIPPGSGHDRVGIPGLLENRKFERARLYRTFVEMWDGLRDTGYFETLQELIAQAPPGMPGDESR